ncbi:sacsin [Patella vulgata]|uniref:sacsin n=1 Tax=Patella vulgata TaxID=6465 RepID=UPI0024A9E987|nr:sacsin [Patella vulgata]
MWTASKFYDKENEVFKVMRNHVDFPSSPFDQEEWKNFMIQAGLKNEVSSEMFVTFAEIIEHAGVNDTTTEQSRTLVRHLNDGEDALNEEFCKRIKNIKFIEGYRLPSTDFRSQIHHQYGCRENFICFNGSFKWIKTNLVWTEADILPSDIILSSTSLGIKTKINRNNFINHLKRICGSLSNGNRLKEIDRKLIIKLFKNLYQYIDDNEDVKRMPELRTLNLIFLPDETIMVNAASLLIESSKDETIKGHIFKFPLKFGEFCALFQELGAWKSAVTDLYLGVLRDICTQCQGKELNPYESGVVKLCMEQLIRLWENKTESESSMTEEYLFLPNRNGILTKSTELILIDNISLYQRVENLSLPYFIGFNEMEIECVDQWRIHNNFPKKYQMKPLRKVVKVTIAHEILANAIQNTIFTNKVSNMLKDEHVLNGIVRLVRHYKEVHRQIIDDKSNNLLDEGIQTLTNIEIFEVANLRTQIIHQDQAVPGSEEPCTIFFVKQDRSEQWSYSLYVDQARSKNRLNEFHRTLSELFRRIFNIDIGGHFRDIWERAVRGKSSETESYLDEQKINCSNPGFNLRYKLFPSVGTNIPEKFHWQLDNSFCDFDKREYVGYEIYDPDIGDTSDDGITVDPPYYIYAKIVEKIQAETDTEFAIYSINVGGEKPIQVTVTKLYKFHRNNTSTSRELVLSERGEAEPQMESSNDNFDIQTVLRDIRQNLTRAWKCLDEVERRRVLKRLLLRWHPDKNPHNVQQSTEIMQHILNYVDRLNRGLSLDEESVPDDETDGTRRSQHNRSYERFYSNVHSTGKKHAKHKEEQRSNRRYYNDNTFHRSARDEPNPSPGQAARWLKQADWDLKAAVQSLSSGASSHNWICYKCQQSAEKALKAVWYKIDANKVTRDHDLNRVANGLPYPNLVQLATELQSTIGEYAGFRYPDTESYPRIPHDAYNKTHSQQACTLAGQIISITTKIIGK